MGVAILHNKMFVIFSRSPDVHVYHADCSDMLLEIVRIPLMEWPHQIIACTVTQKLYIADMQNSDAGCVWLLTADGDYDRYDTILYSCQALLFFCTIWS